MVNKKAKTLDNDLADALGEEKADTLNKTLCYIGAKTLVGALAYALKKNGGQGNISTLAN